MDATRISDNAMVSLKRMEDGLENEIASYFSTEPFASHPHNHCVPVYEVLRVPDLNNVVVIVMPQLRPFNKPRFKSVGESVEFFRQIFEVIVKYYPDISLTELSLRVSNSCINATLHTGMFLYLHAIHIMLISRSDCTLLNIMMDPRPSFPKMFHPVKISRSRDFKSRAKFYTRKRPTQYMFIDFGLSVRFQPGQEHQAIPVFGGDKTVPEFVWKSRKLPYDPFPADVYYLGNLIREEFLQVSACFVFCS